MKIEKYDVYYADLSPVKGSEQGGIRPVVVVQNNIGNCRSRTVIVASITSQHKKMNIPTHVGITMQVGRLPRTSIAILEQIRTIDRSRLIKYIGRLNRESGEAVERASAISLGIDIPKIYRRLYAD